MQDGNAVHSTIPIGMKKGLAASFDLPQQILTCKINFDFILKQTELLSVQSVEAVDNYIEGIVAATWNHQLQLHQFMLIIKLCNTWLTLNGIAED
nr:hypothetical protein CFP56_48059 [Quercus suber]